MTALLLRHRDEAPPSLAWGLDYAGRPVVFPLGVGHFLYAGASGSGKSGVTNALLAAAAPHPIAIVGLDPKRVELTPWARRCAFVAKDPDEIDATLRALRKLMDARYRHMETVRRARSWDPSWGVGGWVLVVLEELAEILRVDVLARPGDRGAKEHAKWRQGVMESLAALARAVGIVLLSSTQRPAAETIGDEFRGNHTHRLCLRVLTEHTARMVFGEVPEGCAPWLIPASSPGSGELLLDEGKALRVRANWHDDDDVDRVVTRTAHLRRVALTLPELLEVLS